MASKADGGIVDLLDVGGSRLIISFLYSAVHLPRLSARPRRRVSTFPPPAPALRLLDGKQGTCRDSEMLNQKVAKKYYSNLTRVAGRLPPPAPGLNFIRQQCLSLASPPPPLLLPPAARGAKPRAPNQNPGGAEGVL